MLYQPNKAIHPGQVVFRVLNREGMTQKSLSERTGLTEKHISQIINGEASITIETSLLLENALGGSASFWINLEKNYQETKARIERNSLIKKELLLLNKFPYSELAKRGFVEQASDKGKKVENLWRFFGVNSLFAVKNTEAVAYRVKSGEKIKSESIAAWLRCGELEAKEQKLLEFSESGLKSSLDELKSLIIKPADEFSKKAQQILNNVGVALVYTPHFPGTGVSGAVRWIGDMPVIQLSLFGAYSDLFWFNLFHEIGHLVLHGKKDKFLEFDLNKRHLSLAQEEEKQADNFANNTLIDQNEYNKFIKNGEFSKSSITKFASENKIILGIVAGRLCHDGYIKWQDGAFLRSKLKFVN